LQQWSGDRGTGQAKPAGGHGGLMMPAHDFGTIGLQHLGMQRQETSACAWRRQEWERRGVKF
jgi:hypothetical protein